MICPAIGFSATAAAVVLSNGIPIFCDVDDSLHMDPAKLEALITPRTVAIAPTHVMGSVADMYPIMEIAARHGLQRDRGLRPVVRRPVSRAVGGHHRRHGHL